MMSCRHQFVVLLLGAALAAGCGKRNVSTTEDSGSDDGATQTTDGTTTKKDKGPGTDGPPVTDGTPTDSTFTPDGPSTPNGKCADAKLLTIAGGKATASGDTSYYGNEYGTAITCGSTSMQNILRGSQQYYKIALKAGTSYLIAVGSQYSYARFYVFTGCGSTQINKDCASNGLTGDVSSSIASGQTGTIMFKPTKAGTYTIAVDATRPSYDGPFTLTVQEYVQPTNTTCSKAKTLTVPSGDKVTVSDTTSSSTNEFGQQIACGDNYNMDGPQLYYRVAMTAGKTYRISWTPQFTYSRVYIFGTTCTAVAINAACGSNGGSGIYSGATSGGNENTRIFKPTKSGAYTISVDSRVASAAGLFKLIIEDWQALDKCASPKKLTLAGGKVTVTGNTDPGTNEFGQQITCGTSSDFDGRQAYYSLSMTAGVTYKMTLQPNFYARLYLFTNTCNPATINSNCGSSGTTGAVTNTISSGNSGGLLFKPSASGTYKIAVDSPYTSSSGHGNFTLTVEKWTPATNGKCAGAKALTLSGGKVKVTGDTTAVPNEFGTQINCDFGYTGAADGKQVYYSIALTKGKSYKVRLKPSFLARYYVFGSTCDPTKIDTACKSSGASGDAATVSAKSTETIVFTPPSSGTYKIAVDSQNSVYYGTFTLEIEEWTPPTNSKCASAKPVTLGSGTTTVSGDTTNIPNEFGTAVNCGSYSLNDILVGSQLYYKVNLAASTSYTFTLTPYFSYGRLYVFTDTCTFSTINGDCGSGGATGLVTSSTSSGDPVTVTFTPTKSGTYKFVVDATRTYTSAAGQFTVGIK